MAAKRKTKAEREAQALEALEQRIADIYAGACGEACDDLSIPISLADAARIIPAARSVFGEPHKDWFGWRVNFLDRWETPRTAAEFLFRHGFSANEVWVAEEPSE